MFIKIIRSKVNGCGEDDATIWTWSSYAANKYFCKHFNNLTGNALFRVLFLGMTQSMWESVCRHNAHYTKYYKDEQSKSLKAMNLQSLHSSSISHAFFLWTWTQASIKLMRKMELNLL